MNINSCCPEGESLEQKKIKIQEEYFELMIEINNGNLERIIEEGLDNATTIIGAIEIAAEKHEDDTKELLERKLNEHNEKLLKVKEVRKNDKIQKSCE